MRPVTELVGRASVREVVNPGDARSGSIFERLTIDGHPYFLKRLTRRGDWIMRVTGDHVHRPYVVWSAGIMDRVPPSIDHAVVAMEVTGSGDDAELAMLMRDIGPWLIPEGDDPITKDDHANFVDHLAELAAAFWGFDEAVDDLTTMHQRFRFFAPDNIAAELDVSEVPGAVAAADKGWRALPERSPLLWTVADAIHADPTILAAPLADTPRTFLQGDWKMGNLGAHPNGRTILLDWAYPGPGPVCWDLWWYIALNRARLPESKEATAERLRAALERLGIPTGDWWQAQLDLCLVGIMAAFAWEKALGEDQELRWWERHVGDALHRQGLAVGG